MIDLPIGAHPYQREKMAIRRDHVTSRPAQTKYEVVERFDGFAAVRVTPKTGRTHQIRVHLAAIGCPVLCDKQYGGRAEITRGEIRRQPDDHEMLLARQALHARRLSLWHPITGAELDFEAPLPADLKRLVGGVANISVLAARRADCREFSLCSRRQTRKPRDGRPWAFLYLMLRMNRFYAVFPISFVRFSSICLTQSRT